MRSVLIAAGIGLIISIFLTPLAIRLFRRQGLGQEVRDDGPGFDPSTAPEGGGLVGMRDRLAVAGGTVEIHSAPGHGTRVSGAVPARST